MNPEADNSQSRPAMPGDDLIIEWLEKHFPDDVVLYTSTVRRDGKMVREDKMGKVKFLQSSPSSEWHLRGGYGFLKKHIVIEVSVEGYIFTGQRSHGGPWSHGSSVGLFAYDGKQLLPLAGADLEKNLGALFLAEALKLDLVDPQEIARFLNEIVVAAGCKRLCAVLRTPGAPSA